MLFHYIRLSPHITQVKNKLHLSCKKENQRRKSETNCKKQRSKILLKVTSMLTPSKSNIFLLRLFGEQEKGNPEIRRVAVSGTVHNIE